MKCMLTYLGRWATPTLSRALHSGTRSSSTAASRIKRVECQLTSEQIYSREEHYGAHNYHPLPVALHKGEGTSNSDWWLIYSAYSAMQFSHWRTLCLSFRNLRLGHRGSSVFRLPERLQRRQSGSLPPKDCRCSESSGVEIDPDLQSVLQWCAGRVWGVHHLTVWLWQSSTHEHR